MIKYLSICLFCIISYNSYAQNDIREKFAYGHLSRNDVTLPFRLFTPDLAKNINDNKYPLILVLHGSGESGNDNETHLNQNFAKGWAEDFVQKKNPCYVLAPQVGFNNVWGDKDINEILDSTLDSLIVNTKVDKNRIYLTGYSMGGWASWYYPYLFPDRFAATVPMSGFWVENFNNLSLDNFVKGYPKIPVWNLHHRKDGDQEITKSRVIIKEFEKNNVNFIHTNPYAENSVKLTNMQIEEYINNGNKSLYTEYDFPCEISTIDCHWIGEFAVKDSLLHKWLFKQNKINDSLDKESSILKKNFKIYPNPTKSYIYIKSPFKTEVYYDLISISGVNLLKGKFNSEKTINLAQFKSGIYIIRLINNSKIYIEKIIIN